MVWWEGVVQGVVHGFGTKGWYKGLLQMFNNGVLQWFGGRASYKVSTWVWYKGLGRGLVTNGK